MPAHPAVTSTWATLRIASKTLDPDEVTAVLDIAPTDSFKPGERHGKEGQLVYAHGQWELTSQDSVQSNDLESHIAWVLDQVEPAQEHLKQIIARPGVRVDVFCFWEASAINAGLGFSPEIMRRTGSLGLPLGIDIYFAF